MLVVAAVFVGFAPSYYLRALSSAAPLPGRVHLHGALSTVWVLLFAAQTFLVARSRTALHRKLGVLAVLLIPLMLVSGLSVALGAARDSTVAVRSAPAAATFLTPGTILVIPLTSILLFAGFASAGLLHRRQPGRHKRLMALATIAMLPPALGRAFFWIFGTLNPTLFFGATVLVVALLFVHDRRTLGHAHPVTLWGGGLLAASFPGRMALGNTYAWSRFADWLIG